jgi:hypothetical protein
METVSKMNFNREWKDIDGLIFSLRSYKKRLRHGETIECLRTLFLMIPYCRDIYRGKGERDLSYRLIYAWYQVFPILAIKSLHLLFDKTTGYMIGSWCDVKYFCLFIEKISPYGLYDPLVSIMIRIANRQLRSDLENLESNIAKWIVRECHHTELFSLFVKDWFRKSSCHLENKKKIYRQMISGLSSRLPKYGFNARFSGIIKNKVLKENMMVQHISEMPSLPIGNYVKAVVEGTFTYGMEIGTDHRIRCWIEYEWNKLLRTFLNICNVGIAVIDLDLTISKEALYNSIGFACLIAIKMKTYRILLAGSVPICIDISECDGFCSMVELLWSHCENRGKSCMIGMRGVIKESIRLFPSTLFGGLRVFIFSDKFVGDLFEDLFEDVKIIFWDIGSLNSINSLDKNDFIYMSGYNSGLIRPFFEENVSTTDVGIPKPCSFIQNYIKLQYSKWNEFFEHCINQ